MKKTLILLSILLTQSAVFAGGGWTQKKGDGFFLLSQRVIAGEFYANSEGNIVESPLLACFTTNFYGEYGFTDKLTGILYTPFLTSLSRAGGIDANGNIFLQDDAFGFGDIDLSVKYKLLSKKVHVAATLTAGIPTGNLNAGSTGTLHLGDGEFSQMLRVDASSSFKKGMFATIFAGFNNRTKGFSDEIHYGGEFGWQKNKFTTILKIYGRKSLFNEPRKDSPIPGIYSDNLEYFSISPQFLYKVKGNVGILAEGGFALAARNIIAAPSITLGVFWDLKK